MKNSVETLKKRNEKRKFFKETIDPNSFPHSILRVCIECELEKECEWTSSFTAKGQPEYRVRCKSCHAKYRNDKIKARRIEVTQQRLKAKYKIKRKCIEYLGGKCVNCAYDKCEKALTFHHIDPKQKVSDVCSLLDRKWELVRAELDKCILLCFNCHMEKEAEIYEHKRTSRKTN